MFVTERHGYGANVQTFHRHARVWVGREEVPPAMKRGIYKMAR